MNLNIKKISTFTSNFLRFTIVIAFFIALYDNLWLTAFLAAVIFAVTFIPSIIGRSYHINLPIEFEIIIIIFIYAALFLGEMRSYYQIFWWWDIMLHTLSGIILGFIGFLIVFALNREKKVNLHMAPGFVAIFSFAFALSIGALWEIFEFIMDTFFGFNMQKSGLVDTMADLIVDSIGALLVSIAGYFYVKKVDFPVFDHLIERFIEKNPKVFRKRKN